MAMIRTDLPYPAARASIDGVLMPLDQARLPIADQGVARGDGGFETCGVWDGEPFRLEDHLRRLNRTLDAIALPPADLDQVRAEAGALLEGWTGDGALRLYITATGTRAFTLSPPPDRLPARVLVPQPAPWIRPLGTYGPSGAKTMSYLPNMVATRAAVRAGGDDALLVALEGWILEGPTFAVLWVRDGVLRSAASELGVIESVTRMTVLEAAGAEGIPVELGRWQLEELDGADEVLVCSAVRDVIAVEYVGERHYPGPFPVRDRLSAALWAARRATAAVPVRGEAPAR
jgi:branched-subunit amino acid aminotransferase/4-amino-4-deoxychorismate lyase